MREVRLYLKCLVRQDSGLLYLLVNNGWHLKGAQKEVPTQLSKIGN